MQQLINSILTIFQQRQMVLLLQQHKLPTLLSLTRYICQLNSIACQAQMEPQLLHTTIQPWIKERMFPQLIQALIICTLAIPR